MNCTKCGAPVDENPSRELLQCEHCGHQFSTPEHSELYSRFRRDEEAKAVAAAQAERERLQAEERKRQAELETQERRKAEIGQTARRAASLTARTIRSVVFLALGAGVFVYALPLVFQYGALRALGGDILPRVLKIPQLKSLYSFAPPLLGTYYFQIFIGALLGLSALFIRNSLRK